MYLGVRGKLKIFISGKLSFSDAKSPQIPAKEWDRDNFMFMTWLWNSMELYVFADFMFASVTTIWDAARDTSLWRVTTLRSLRCMGRYLVFTKVTS